MTILDSGVFSSASDLWETPQELFDALNAKYHFTLDVCATPANAKCARFFTPEQDGLAQVWAGTCWMNPPYGRAIGRWIRKAYECAQAGVTVVCLVPARTDTAWWHDYVMHGEIEYLRGRVYFTDGAGKRGRAPFPSAIVVFLGRLELTHDKPLDEFERLRADRDSAVAAERARMARWWATRKIRNWSGEEVALWIQEGWDHDGIMVISV